MGYLLIIAAFIASMGVSWMLKRRFKEYSQMPIGFSGQEIAEQMLREYGITDVQVISTPGQLTDHYDPRNKTVNLSEVVFNQRNVAAAAVAAHECGHAVQHAKAYSFLTMRSQLIPIVSFASQWMQWVLMAGIGLLMFTGSKLVLAIGVVLFAFTTLFSFVTLPVEFDASNRALAWLDNARVMRSDQHAKAKNALWWAAMTYVVAALGSLANLLYYLMILMSGDD